MRAVTVKEKMMRMGTDMEMEINYSDIQIMAMLTKVLDTQGSHVLFVINMRLLIQLWTL